MHTAVENQQMASIDYLVTNGADTAARNDKYFTPLILAIDLGYVDVVEVSNPGTSWVWTDDI